MKKIKGFEYYIDTEGNLYREYLKGYKKIKQHSLNCCLIKDNKKHYFNKNELVTSTYLGVKPKDQYILIKDGNTKNNSLDNLTYVRWEHVGKKIKGFENYLINRKGEVYIIKKDKIIKQQEFTTKRGYKQIKLRKNNKVYSYLVHRLVAQAFLPNIDNKMDVIHLTNNKADNSVYNLKWCTGKANTSSIGFHKESINNNTMCSLFIGDKFVDNFKSIAECCKFAKEKYGCSYSSLRRYKVSGKYKIKEPQITT
ncbi:HNH endonuclease [Terrisporobacter sp.]|uniref:HNH endonuclease n=1 Tax=Terrisporobacter sp. TaxID=1965305 RepID=UPI003995C168